MGEEEDHPISLVGRVHRLRHLVRNRWALRLLHRCLWLNSRRGAHHSMAHCNGYWNIKINFYHSASKGTCNTHIIEVCLIDMLSQYMFLEIYL